MGLLNDLGDVFHAIGNFVAGSDNNAPQPNQPRPPLPVQPPTPAQAPVQQPTIIQPQQPSFSVNPLPTANNPGFNLVKANTPPTVTAQPTTVAPSGGGGFLHDITHNDLTQWGGDTLKAAGGLAAGASLGVLRAGTGFAQGIANLPLLAARAGANAGTFIGNKIAGKNLSDPAEGLLNRATNDLNTPFNDVNKNIDLAAEAYGPASQDIYKPAQVAANVATVIPGAEALLSKAPVIGDHLGQVGDFIEGQRAMPTLTKAINFIRPGDEAADAAEVAKTGPTLDSVADKQPGEIAVGLSSSNPDQINDAIDQGNQKIAQVTPQTPPEVDNTPAYQRGYPTPAPGPNMPAPNPTGLDIPTFQHNQAIQAVIDQGNSELNDYVNTHPNLTPQELDEAKTSITQQVTDQVNKMQADRAGAVEAAAKTPAPVEATPTAPAAVAPAPTPVEPLVPTAMHSTETADLKTLDNAAKERLLTPEEKSVRTALQTKKDALAGANEPPKTTPTGAVVLPTTPVEATPNPTGTIPTATTDTELKNARFQAAIVSKTDNPALRAALEDAAANKDTKPLSAIDADAIKNVQSMSLTDLVQKYGQDFEDDHGPITNPQGLYENLEAMRQFDKTPNDPIAQKASTNALRAINEYANKSGVGVRSMQIAYNDMPTSMKVGYLQKMVAKAGGDLSNPADVQALYDAADKQGQLGQVAQTAENKTSEIASTSSQADPNFNKTMGTSLYDEAKAKAAYYKQNRVIIDMLQKNLPRSSAADEVLQNARTMMLSSGSGRAFALIGTIFNTVAYMADTGLSSMFGKAINAINDLRAGGEDITNVKTSMPKLSTLIKGGWSGGKQLAGDTFGKAPVKAIDKGLTAPYDSEYSHDVTRYGRFGQNALVSLPRKIVRFAVGTHMALTKGVEDIELERSAIQAAKDANIPAENVKGFTKWYTTHAPQVQAKEAEQMRLGVNNLHTNKISTALGKVADAIGNTAEQHMSGPAGGVMNFVSKQIRGLAIPFSHYMGGFLDKALTDRNMLYNVYKIATADSPQVLADQLGKLTTNVGTAAGLGYTLAKTGVITTTDQDGKNYDGMYFHIGHNFIPIAWAGQSAMPLIMGASFQQSIADGSKGGSWGTNVVKIISQVGESSFGNIMKATGIAGTFGGDSSINNLMGGNIEKGIPQATGAIVQQHIPAAFGDVNAFLNQSRANPTHELANTKVTSLNPTTGQQDENYTRTALNKVYNAIPGFSQMLPRASGEAAPTEAARLVKAGTQSVQQIVAANQTKAQGQQVQANLKAGIPVFDKTGNDVTVTGLPKGYSYTNSLNTTIQNGQYDNAVKGLQQELKYDTTPGPLHIPPSTVQGVKDHITQLQVLSANHVSPTLMTLYGKTTVTEWRDMGDPTNAAYNPTLYNQLYALDQSLAAKGVASTTISDVTGAKSTQKYTASTSSSSSTATDTIKDNTIGTMPVYPLENFTNLNFRPITTKIAEPALQSPGSLIKARKISVTSPHP